MLTRIVVLCGPTAVGKSKIALELAQQHQGEIVSADSQQVYKDLDIGTAKPTPAERSKISHHLIDVASPDESFDVSRYAALADQAIADIAKRGRLPLVVGGAGMYIRILLYGLCDAPPQDKAVRQRLLQRVETEGLKKLYAELKKIDGEAAQKIHPNDKNRIIRALEVHELTGYPLSHFQQRHRFAKPRYEARQIGLNIDRKVLHQNIERRVDWMIANGWVEEVRELLKFYPSECQALQSIGYKQIVRHLKGQASLPATIEEIKKETRALARRQLTWFRADKNIRWFDPADAGWSRALNS
ncbi:MAG: tRNA (adenosine(37)-N6)-dimethylallyltransferase MiaA [Deltaproteobacteria bacterium]|nr:tRNA (adenosine(37)-N6)-dimethylallyltransferase MiaA [Deltaproteobacteria bacterium]